MTEPLMAKDNVQRNTMPPKAWQMMLFWFCPFTCYRTDGRANLMCCTLCKKIRSQTSFLGGLLSAQKACEQQKGHCLHVPHCHVNIGRVLLYGINMLSLSHIYMTMSPSLKCPWMLSGVLVCHYHTHCLCSCWILSGQWKRELLNH